MNTVGDACSSGETNVREKSRRSVVEDLRGRIARIGGGVPEMQSPPPVAETSVSPASSSPSTPQPTSQQVRVPDWLGRHLVAGGLPRGGVTVADDCPAALVDVLAVVTAGGGCAAVVGHPRLALAAVAAAGGDLERMVVVPDPAPHATAVLGTLVDGLDLVIYLPPKAVAPTSARPVEARLRRSQCSLMVCGGSRTAQPWPNARLHLSWRTEGVTGLGCGSGRVRGVTVSGQAWGQGQPPQMFRENIGGPAAGTTPGPAPDHGELWQERAL